jgi:hypothetical protein
MPTVWMRRDPKRRTRFHRSPDCRQLTKGPARGDGHELIAVDLEDVHVRPCHSCYPDAPRIKVRHPYCYTCGTAHACEHNGGVLIRDRAGRRFYVWPDTNQMPLYRRSA